MTTRECERFSFTRTGYMILRTTETTTRTASGKSWKAHPDTIVNEIITPEHYTNIVTSVPFFNRFGYGASCRAVCNYTVAGYVPVRITSIAPNRETKSVITISFIDRSQMERAAGYREREIMQYAKGFRRVWQDGNDRIYLLDSDGCEIGIYNNSKHVWEG